MPCTRPITPEGRISPVACGQCMDCRLRRSRDWAFRMMYEARQHEANSFLTLTYDDDHLPDDMSLNVKHWQLFAKRLRRAGMPFRFFMCGEYGDRTLRPHYHVCMFGQDFAADRSQFKIQNGYPLYTSEKVSALWPHGYHLIGELTFDSACYVARYVTKKVLGTSPESERLRETRYRRFDLDTGETWMVRPEFSTQSRGGRGGQGGIGKAHYDKWRDDIYHHGFVTHNGREFSPPRYFDRLLKEENPEKYDEMVRLRTETFDNPERSNPQRLRARERILQSRMKLRDRAN